MERIVIKQRQNLKILTDKVIPDDDVKPAHDWTLHWRATDEQRAMKRVGVYAPDMAR